SRRPSRAGCRSASLRRRRAARRARRTCRPGAPRDRPPRRSATRGARRRAPAPPARAARRAPRRPHRARSSRPGSILERTKTRHSTFPGPGAKDPMAAVIEKTDEQQAICEMVRQFADEQIIPNAEHYDHEDAFPAPIVEQMKELGLFGVTIPEEYGGMGLDLTTYAMIVEELSRGWISISGVVNTHFIGSYLLMKFGTEEQKQEFLPRMATGEIRAAFSLSEPEVGSDVQGIKATATK